MQTCRHVESLMVCLLHELLDWQFLGNFFDVSRPDAQYSFLLKKLETFLKLSCQVTFASSSKSDVLQSSTVGSDGKGVHDDSSSDDFFSSR